MNKMKWIAGLLVAAAASVSMGADAKFLNTSGDGRWENPDNWELGVLPTDQDNAFRVNPGSLTCTVSSSNTINNLRINEGGAGGVTLHMDNAWLTILTNQWSSLAYNVVGAPSTLTMTNSTILHLALITGVSTNENGHFNVGHYRSDCGETTSTLIMDNSHIILERGSLRMIPNTSHVSDLVVDAGITNTITLNNGSSIETSHMSNMDNGMIYLNSGSYIKSRSTVEPQLDVLINNGWIVVDGVTVTPENKSNYVYTDATSTYVIPEPATVSLMAFAGLIAFAVRRHFCK